MTYTRNFLNMNGRTWQQLWDNFVGILFYGKSGKDPGFHLFVKLIRTFTSSAVLYRLIIAAIFTFPLGKFIKRNSREPSISFVLYMCLFFNFFGITGDRQTIATALVVLIGFEYIKERKLKKFIFVSLIALTIHQSSVLFFPFYFLANRKIRKFDTFAFLMLIPVMFVFRSSVVKIMAAVIGRYDTYAEQYSTRGAITFTILLFLVTCVAFFRKKEILRNNPEAIRFFNALMIAVLFTPLTFLTPALMRVVQYYSIFLLLLVPDIVLSFKKEEIYPYLVSILVLLYLFFQRSNVYYFFWQNPF